MRTPKSKFKVVELYAGTGRSVEPFRSWRRAQVSLLVDNSRYAFDTYLLNYPRAPYACGSMNSLSPPELVALSGGQIDVLLGCPPCQGFSECGERRADDPRNRHINRFAAVARHARPLVIGVENVPLAWDSAQFRRFVSGLEQDGYSWSATIANAALYGSCQVRQRLLLVAVRGDVRIDPVFPLPTHGGGNGRIFSYSASTFKKVSDDPVEMLGMSPATQRLAAQLPADYSRILGPLDVPTLSDTLEGLPRTGTAVAQKIAHNHWPHSAEIYRRMGRLPEGGRWRGGADHYSHAYGRLHRRGLARTVTTHFPYAGAGRFWHPVENRSLTVREAARIQGFSDCFQFLGSDRSAARLVGNALDSRFASMVYKVCRDVLE